MRRNKRFLSIAVLICLLIIWEQPVFADEPYKGYIYDDMWYAVPSPNGYIPDKVVTGEDMGAGSLNNPQDLFVDGGGNVYILDSGNNRIVVTDSQFKLVKVIDIFTSKDGEEKLNSPSGLYVTKDKKIYIADTGNNRVLVSDMDGCISVEMTRPTDRIYPVDVTFNPKKLVVDRLGNVYVAVMGMYYGAVVFSPEGKFLGFFGSNRIETTLNVLTDFLWKTILTRTQRQHMKRNVAVEFTNLAIDQDGFVYTCTEAPLQFTDRVKKLSLAGINLFKDKDWKQIWFGDYDDMYDESSHRYIGTRLIDICTDKDGLINVLDYQRGRVFQYDNEGRRLLVFGGIGDQLGLSKAPVALESLDDRILLLDSDRKRITVYKLTSFGKSIHDAIRLFNQGLYAEAITPWQEVLKRDCNYITAYVGIGNALYNDGKYREAMDYFRLGGDKTGFNKSFKGYRNELLRRYFTPLFILVFILFLLPWGMRQWKRVKRIKQQRRFEKSYLNRTAVNKEVIR